MLLAGERAAGLKGRFKGATRTIATTPRFWSYVRRANLVDALAVVKPLANLIGALQREFPAYQVAVKGATIDHT